MPLNNTTTEPTRNASASPTGKTVPEQKTRTNRVRMHVNRGVLWCIGALVVGGLGFAGLKYLTTWRFEVSTDDAYIQADVVAIASQVAGNIKAVMVQDNQSVRAGDLLAVVDESQYQAAVDQAGAAVDQAQAGVGTIVAEIAQQEAAIKEVEATIAADQALERFAEQNDRRYGTLARDGYGSVQNAQQAASQIESQRAIVAKDQAALEAAKQQVATLNAKLDQARASLSGSQAALMRANIDLGYTTIRSPVGGVVGNRTLRVGQYAQPGSELLAIVPLDKVYVVANFKETEIAHVRNGDLVSLVVDTFSGRTVKGYVQSLGPASGQEFALLPPDNATGNFTKVVQRVPIKIAVDAGDALAGKLRPGMSVTATIDVRRNAAPRK